MIIKHIDISHIQIHPGVEALHGPVVFLQPGKAVDEVGAQGRVNMLGSKLASIRSVVSPGAPVTHNLQSNITILAFI